MAEKLTSRVRDLLADLSLAGPDDDLLVRPLTGGIASDVAVVETSNQKFCVKFALHKMRVTADWFAPIRRNRTEYLWLKFANSLAPENTPRLFGHSETAGGFVMEFLDGTDTHMWKSRILTGSPRVEYARTTGTLLGRIHSASSSPGFDADLFDTGDVFFHMRIEPYILYTSSRHPDLAFVLDSMAESLDRSAVVLVHGDVSPKNIIIHEGRVVLVDAECASMGEPAFDVAFCLNHMFLKGLYNRRYRREFMHAALEFWSSYAQHITWEEREFLASRTARLLPALALARVDGKSPVEYLDDAQQDLVRRVAIPLIINPVGSVSGVLMHLFDQLTDEDD